MDLSDDFDSESGEVELSAGGLARLNDSGFEFGEGTITQAPRH
jgi:hypothetical protein